MSFFNPGLALMINSLGFLASFLAILNLRTASLPHQDAFSQKNYLQELKEGFQFPWRTPTLFWLNAAQSISIFGVTIFLTLLVFHLKNTSHLSVKDIGYLLSIGGITAIAGNFLTNNLIRHFSYKTILWTGFLIGGLSVIWFGYAQSYITLMLANALGTLAASALNPCIRTLRQKLAPPELLGRVQSISRFMTWSLIPIAAILAGGLSEKFGTSHTIIFAGIIATLAVSLFALPPLRENAR